MPLLAKPELCTPCTLHEKGHGFAPADGPSSSWLLLVGESLGITEALTGRPFMGDAGGMLNRLLTLLGWKRDAIRIHNVISCQPPGDWFDERAPWYWPALGYCPYLAHTLNEAHEVVVTMGATALKRVMGLEHAKDIRVQDWHGTINRDPTDRFWVVPTFHPSYLQRGATNLIGTVLWDLQQAESARQGRPPDPASLIVDPPLEWFRAWVDTVVAARRQDPAAYPISSDVETPDKQGGRDEGELGSEDRSFQIIRQNVACHPDEGVTVPNAEGYLAELARLYSSPGEIWMWNREYDFTRQVAAGLMAEADSVKVVDLMWLAHFLQSDIPRGLGFWAPFYSGFGPWKHKARSEPGLYGAADGLQTHRVGFGVLTDLQRLGMYEMAMRHTHRLLSGVLRPAQLVGVKVDRQRLQIFKAELVEKARASLTAIQACVPESLQPLTPKGGLVHRPASNVLHVKATAFTRRGTARAGKPVPEIKQELYAQSEVVERLVLREVLVCRTCGAREVQRRHCCAPPQPAPPTGGDHPADQPALPEVVLDVASVTRYFWREPFNPDSWPQVLGYLKAKKHRPGRSKKSKSEESTDRETLLRLSRTTQDPFYGHVLDYRAVAKVKGTYVEGTERRLDADDRLHPVPTFRPSMMRLSYVDPNITNVVADKGGAEGLAAGFRSCIVATTGCRLLEADFSAIEAVQVGWCARDPTLMRLARLGIHSYLIASRLKDAPDLKGADADIARHLKAVKAKAGALLYDQMKHTVYGVFYGQTPIGLQYTWPHLYPSQKAAEELVDFMFAHFPSVRIFQQAVCDQAARQHYLGGPGAYRFTPPAPGVAGSVLGHPFGYKHWFWSIYTFRRLTRAQELRLLAKYQKAGGGKAAPITYINDQPFRIARGSDANRAIALYPQSIAAGDLKEVELRLFTDPESPSYIGDAYFGRTPLRAPIHDSLLLEVPFRQWDRVAEKVALEMQRPIEQQPNDPAWGLGDYLRIGIAAKAGLNWNDTVDLAPSEYEPEVALRAAEPDDEEDFDDLARAV